MIAASSPFEMWRVRHLSSLAALNGSIQAFLCLNFHCQEKHHSLIRDNNGDTILHAASPVNTSVWHFR
ncbi:hypothetical protein M0R45_020319 [Rubus argutus]|uniref:Uncharacterized protein n=1 Tax=Rubus argutus TaxID=59490 RepID=A0AAW1XA48_RUBAR